MVTAKDSKQDTYNLAPLQVRKTVVIDTALYGIPIGNECMVKILLVIKFWNIFSRSSSTTNEPTVYCIHMYELLNVFEYPPQRVHIM